MNLPSDDLEKNIFCNRDRVGMKILNLEPVVVLCRRWCTCFRLRTHRNISFNYEPLKDKFLWITVYFILIKSQCKRDSCGLTYTFSQWSILFFPAVVGRWFCWLFRSLSRCALIEPISSWYFSTGMSKSRGLLLATNYVSDSQTIWGYFPACHPHEPSASFVTLK